MELPDPDKRSGWTIRCCNIDDFAYEAISSKQAIDAWNTRAITPAPMPEEPTVEQLVDACLSYNHGYGLMDPEERDKLHNEAKDWWRCIVRAIANGGEDE